MKKLSMTSAMLLSVIPTIGVAVVAYVAVYLLLLLTLSNILPNRDMVPRLCASGAQIAACAFLGLLIPIYKYLRQKELRAIALNPSLGIDIERHTSKWYLLLVYGSLILFGINEFGGGVVGFFSEALMLGLRTNHGLSEELAGQVWPALITMGSIPLNLFVRPISIFLVANWIGKRSSRFGVLVMSAVLVLPVLVDLLFAVAIPDIATKFGQTEGEFALRLVFGFLGYCLVAIPIGLFGYWRGRRGKLMAVLKDVLKVLPNETQTHMLDVIQKDIMNSRGEVPVVS